MARDRCTKISEKYSALDDNLIDLFTHIQVEEGKAAEKFSELRSA